MRVNIAIMRAFVRLRETLMAQQNWLKNWPISSVALMVTTSIFNRYLTRFANL